MQTELLISNLREKNNERVDFTAEILFNTSWQLAFTLTSKASGSSLVFKILFEFILNLSKWRLLPWSAFYNVAYIFSRYYCNYYGGETNFVTEFPL